MNLTRIAFDLFYDLTKPVIFTLTQEDPETAHTLFVNLCRTLYKTGLDEFVLDNTKNHHDALVPISNAGGLNKNGEIPPQTLRYMGFDRVVVGTVTGEEWAGNPRPRTKRYVETESLLNWMGLPGIGAERVAENLERFGNHEVPLTINLMATPGKTGDEALKDLERTVLSTRDLLYVDRYELNISCPNTESRKGGRDARCESSRQLKDMLMTVCPLLRFHQELDIKVSPDLTELEMDSMLETTQYFPVRGYTPTNTTTYHDPFFISHSPGKGGASGNALYMRSLNTQKRFVEKTRNFQQPPRINACGGINSAAKLIERVDAGATEAQVYTGLIFTGPKLLRRLRSA